MEAGPGLRLVARTAEPVLLRCPVGARTLDIPTGEWLTVAGSAVLARDASLGCVALERKDAAGARQGERRLTGPGRVLLGFWPVERYP
jgi:hypothetical protein